jgi:hypothetical protein
MNIQTNTYKYVQLLYVSWTFTEVLRPWLCLGLCPGYSCICMYMYEWVCLYMYMHVHAMSCMYSVCVCTYLRLYARMCNYKCTGIRVQWIHCWQSQTIRHSFSDTLLAVETMYSMSKCKNTVLTFWFLVWLMHHKRRGDFTHLPRWSIQRSWLPCSSR